MNSRKETDLGISDVSPRTTALVIIDMQNDVMDMVPPGRQIVPAIKRVLDACRSKGIPVIHKIRIQRPDGIDVERFRIEMFKSKPYLVKGTSGAEIVLELKPAEVELKVQGARFSGFFQTDMHLVLTRLGVKKLVICGVQTPNCIRSTVTDAIGYDYDVILLKDATAAQTQQVHEANLFDMKNMGITIISSEEFLSMI